MKFRRPGQPRLTPLHATVRSTSPRRGNKAPRVIVGAVTTASSASYPAARARGIHAVNGLGMLVHQAALAFESWTGSDAPVTAMRTAALAAAPTGDAP